MAAGDFTNIRAESISPDTVVIRYTYAGSGDIELHRSTDGSVYAEVQSIPAAYGSYPTITETGLASETLYYYKFSDDAGSTFTSAVTVKTHKAFPPSDRDPEKLDLPTFVVDEDVNASNVDLIRTQLETYLNRRTIPRTAPCQVCPVNGAIVLDCQEGCYNFIVKATDIADINSITVNCDRGTIDFDVPEGTETEICGWPEATRFGGDECFQAPISAPVQMGFSTIVPPDDCNEARTRMVTAPCLGDYIYECFDGGSYFRTSGNRSLAVVSCSCASVNGGINSTTSSLGGGSFTFTVVSGKQTGVTSQDHKSMGGFTLYYKSVNSNCAGVSANYIYDYVVGGFGAGAMTWTRIGKPIFGFAVNVPEGVTTKAFTGKVLLFDFPNSRFLWGSYSNADLSAGDMPTTIATMDMSVITPTQVELIIDGTVGQTYANADVILENGSDTQTMAQTAITPIAQPVGFGIVWVGNNAPGNHAATIVMPDEDALLWWD